MSAITRYQVELQAEFVQSGHLPRVVILGSHDYDELIGELYTVFGIGFKSVETGAQQFPQYEGIAIFKNACNARGFWFGGMPV